MNSSWRITLIYVCLGRSGMRAAAILGLFFGLVARAEHPGATTLQVQLHAQSGFVDDTSVAGVTLVRHPWPVQDALDSDELPLRVANLRDGVIFTVAAAPGLLAPLIHVNLFVSLFSFSYMISSASTEQWLRESGIPGPQEPLRLTTLFSQLDSGGALQADGLGDVCVGEAFKADFCARVSTCFKVRAGSDGSGIWRFAVPVKFAANYRIEVYTSIEPSSCRTYKSGSGDASLVHWAPPVADHAVIQQLRSAQLATASQFRLLFVNKVNWWWGHHARVQPSTTWSEMMGAAVQAGANSVAASPATYGLFDQLRMGLWLEFGVATGMSTAFIASLMRQFGGDEVKLHGFDSFQGLPSSWENTQLGAGAFSRGGVVPEHLSDFPNVQLHVGLFSETLRDLDAFGPSPVAFAHIDVDIYASAIEVLTKIACQLYPGTILVFDELVNYNDFEVSGEYLAWEYISTRYQIGWEYVGLFWQQAVPVLILSRGGTC